METTKPSLSRTEWDGNLEYARQALARHDIGPEEQSEFLELFTRYKSEIVDGLSATV